MRGREGLQTVMSSSSTIHAEDALQGRVSLMKSAKDACFYGPVPGGIPTLMHRSQGTDTATQTRLLMTSERQAYRNLRQLILRAYPCDALKVSCRA